jgi:hypothetical protein
MTPEEVAKERPPHNSPRFVAFVGEVLCQVPSFQDALFVTFLHTIIIISPGLSYCH